jgi:hypothetical protein
MSLLSPPWLNAHILNEYFNLNHIKELVKSHGNGVPFTSRDGKKYIAWNSDLHYDRNNVTGQGEINPGSHPQKK